MYKVVVNRCYGGFGLSEEAQKQLDTHKGKHISEYDIPRHDKDLVAIVEELGDKASDKYADLEIAQIKSNKYNIREYDGMEYVETPDSIDWVVINE